MESFATFRVDRERLVGMLHRPDLPGHAGAAGCVVMLHDLGGDRSERGRLFTLAARAFAQAGLAVLRFDFRGSGDSDGDHAEFTISRGVSDTLAAVEYVRQLPDIDPERVSLLGYGLGGLVAALSAREARAHRLALWAPALPADLLRLLPGGQLPGSLLEFEGQGIGRAFVAELPRVDSLRAVATAAADTHVFHAERDEVVAPASGESYAGAAAAPFSVVPRVGHAFERLAAREALFEGTGRFLRGSFGLR